MKNALVTALMLLCGAALAQSSINGNAKATFQTSYTALLKPISTSTASGGQLVVSPWTTILEQQLKTANNWDLVVTPSFEVGLLTQTTVSSKNMVTDTSTATACVKVRVLVDGVPIAPGEVSYGKRTQQLTATLEGAIGNCLTNTVSTNSAGGIVVITTVNTNCVTPEVIGLLQDSVSANSFTFCAPSQSTGVHDVSVQAEIVAMGDNQNGTFTASALLGKGTLTVESSRTVKAGTQLVLGQ